MGTEVRNIIEDVMEASLNSAKAKKLVLHQKNKRFETRSQIHTMLVMPFGSGKTTSLIEAPKKKMSILTEYTAPGMLGSISKDGRPILGEIVKCAGMCVGLDEIQKYTYTCRDALLNLLEQQFYNRNLGYGSLTTIKQNRKYYKILLKQGDNTMRIESRFSCIATGTFKPNVTKNDPRKSLAQSQNEMAYMSRFVVFGLALDLPDMYKIIRGEPVFSIKGKDNYEETPEFEDYLKMSRQHEKIATGLKFIRKFGPDKFGFLTRNCLDIARLSAYKDRGSGSVEIWPDLLQFIPLFLYNIVSSTLSLGQFKVLNNYQKNQFSQKEIAEELQVSEAYVSKVIVQLSDLGLLVNKEDLVV